MAEKRIRGVILGGLKKRPKQYKRVSKKSPGSFGESGPRVLGNLTIGNGMELLGFDRAYPKRLLDFDGRVRRWRVGLPKEKTRNRRGKVTL